MAQTSADTMKLIGLRADISFKRKKQKYNKIALNLFIPTFFLTVAKMSLSKYSAPSRSNPPFLISDIRALWRSGLSARVPECQKIKNDGLDQYGPERFEV